MIIKTMKKLPLLLIILCVSALFAAADVSAATVFSDIATFTFSKPSSATGDKDLNDTYKTNADNGYLAYSGTYKSSSYLFASVSGSLSNFRKMEWTKDGSYSFDGKNVSATPIMAAGKNNPWGSAPFFLIKTKTSDFENIKLKFKIGGSKKGPKNFKVQTSKDGKSYTDVSSSSFSIASNKVLYEKSFNLPSSSDDLGTLYIRIIATSTATIAGDKLTTTPTGGESAINNIVISGTKKIVATPAPGKATQAPASNTQANNTQANNSTVVASKKTLTKPVLTAYKKGTKKIKGTATKNSTLKIKVAGKTYKLKCSSKGRFTLTLSKKLKKGNVIKITSTLKGVKGSKVSKYKVK